LENGDLWVWSPVKLAADLRAEVDRLGPVRHLVSPNKLHHLYLSEWKAAFPGAQLWGPRSTIKKRPDLDFRGALQDDPPSEWLPDIDQAWFRGSFVMENLRFDDRDVGVGRALTRDTHRVRVSSKRRNNQSADFDIA
jgi:hypothetical protein